MVLESWGRGGNGFSVSMLNHLGILEFLLSDLVQLSIVNGVLFGG